MKKLLPLILLLSMALCLLSGCGSPAAAPSDAPGETRTVTDGVGRAVEIPAVVESIVPLGNTPRMITYLGLADRAVGIEACETADSPIKAYAYVVQDHWKDLPIVGNNSLGASEWYAEELVACAPDVILCTYDKQTADDIQAQTGIPVIAVDQGALFDERYNESLRILGEVCGVSDRAEAVVKYISDTLADISTRVADIPDDDKPTVLAAGATFKGGHSIDGVYCRYPLFDVLKANDVAAGISDSMGGKLVDKEQILAWDPEMIFFDSGSMALVNTDYAENPDYFSQLQAVNNGELYQWPNSTWHWSNVEIPLVSAYYVGSVLYPEAFADVDFEAKASEIFDFFLSAPDFLTVLEDAGAGYGKITLGN